MMSSALRNWQQDNHFRMEDDTVYGVYQSVGFAVADDDGGKLFTFMLSGEDEAFDSIEDMLAAQSGFLAQVQVGDVENYLALFFEETGGNMSPSMMTALLDFIVANYRVCRFRAPNVCVKCGAPANKRAFYNNMVQPMCVSCRDAEKAAKSRAAGAYGGDTLVPKHSSYDESYDEYAGMENQPRRQMPVYDESYNDRDSAPQDDAPGHGGLGAFLGALGGVALFYASALFGLPLACFCFVAGILALVGYKAFGGKRDIKSAKTSIITWSQVLSVLAVFIISFFKNFASNASGLSQAFSAMLSDIATWINLGIAVGAALLGALIEVDRLERYCKR